MFRARFDNLANFGPAKILTMPKIMRCVSKSGTNETNETKYVKQMTAIALVLFERLLRRGLSQNLKK